MSDKAHRDRKRCLRCEGLLQELGKRAYERLQFDQPVDSRPTYRGRKAHCDGLLHRRIVWQPGDEMYREVLAALGGGELVQDTMRRLSITYKVYRAIGEHILGREGYRAKAHKRKVAVGSKNLAVAHANYEALTPKEKARFLKKKFGRSCGLERGFADQLRARGVLPWRMNQWQSIPINGDRVPREADIKLALDDGRKIVILCDGEAFHGPGTIFGDPQAKIETDRQTALGFFGLGYSVVRYAESEVHDGTAVDHLLQMLVQLQSCQKVYRNWCPAEEVVI